METRMTYEVELRVELDKKTNEVKFMIGDDPLPVFQIDVNQAATLSDIILNVSDIERG